MKKLIAFLLAVCMLFGLVACNVSNEPQASTSPSAQDTTAPEDEFIIPTIEKEEVSYDDVDELTPVNGEYQVHSLVGVQNMAKHPDGRFNILCDIDLGGAVLEPIGSKDTPFTGQIKGNEFTISNFKIEQPTKDGDMGFIGVNEGVVIQLQLADMTMTATKDTVRMGALAGTNNGRIQRCNVQGALTVEEAAAPTQCGGAAGVHTGDLKNSIIDLDITYKAAGAANIGGLVGSTTAGEITDSDAYGFFEVTDGKDKNVGLYAGYIKDVNVVRSVFLGEKNLVDGKLYTTYLGKAENAGTEDCLWRDNSAEELPDQVRQTREKAVQSMYDMGTVIWTTSELLPAECVPGCNAEICRMALVPGTYYRGVPYKHNAGSLDRLMYLMDENNVLKAEAAQWGNVGGYQNYMGSDCYRACQLAWSTVANSMNSGNAMSTIMYTDDVNVIPVGQWAEKWPAEARLNDSLTTRVNNYMTEQELYETYAQIRAGDVLVQILSKGAHAIMACIDAVVVRDENGLIDPSESYIHNHEQGGDQNTSDEWKTSWGIDVKKTFGRLYGESYLPITIEELLEGEKDVPEASVVDGADGILGLTTGIVKSNFYVDSVTMEITDSKGNEVFNKKMFARIDKITDYDSVSMFERTLTDTFDLANFTNDIMGLTFADGETYNCTITANLHTFDQIVVKEFSF